MRNIDPTRQAPWLLRHLELFEGLPDDRLQALVPTATVAEVKRRKVLYLPGDPADSAIFLCGGQVRCSRIGPDGRSLTVAEYRARELVGGENLMVGEPREELAETMSSAIVLRLPRAHVAALIEEMPVLATRLVGTLARQRRDLAAKIEGLAFRTARARLAGELYALAERRGKDTPKGVVVEPMLRHHELASLVGTSRETASVILGALRRQGVLDFTRRALVIHDVAELRALVHAG